MGQRDREERQGGVEIADVGLGKVSEQPGGEGEGRQAAVAS